MIYQQRHVVTSNVTQKCKCYLQLLR